METITILLLGLIRSFIYFLVVIAGFLVGPSLANDNSLIEVQSWRYNITSQDYCEVVGEIKNVSSEELKSVRVVATFYDKNDDIVTNNDSYIDANPFESGTMTTFKVITRIMPGMERVKIKFMDFAGKQIQYRELLKKQRKKNK